MEQFAETVKVEKKTFHGEYEADLILTIMKRDVEPKKVECFIYDDKDLSGFSEGETAKVYFNMVEFSVQKLNKKINNAKQVRSSTNAYVIEGKIIQVRQHPHKNYQDYQKIAVDCGFFVETKVKKSDNFKVGDYVKIEGRLDVHKFSDEDVTE